MTRSGEIDALYRRHAGNARAFAVALTGDAAFAEDLVQDAFIRTASRLGGLRDPEKFQAYLFTTIARTASSEFRRRRSERRALQRIASQAPAPPAVVEPEGLAAELVSALRSLPARQRTALAARFLFDWSELQTAEAMGCRVGTVKSLTSRALASLRTVITTREDVNHD